MTRGPSCQKSACVKARLHLKVKPGPKLTQDRGPEQALSHYSVVTPQSPLALPHLSRVSLSSLSLSLLVCVLCLCSCLHLWPPHPLPSLSFPLHVVFAFTFVVVCSPPSPPLLPCLHTRPPLSPLHRVCVHGWPPSGVPIRALFTFMTPLVIVFMFNRPPPFMFTTVPVFACRAGPRRPRLCLCRGLLVRYVIGTLAGMPSLMASLSSLLSPCTGPRHPRPCRVSMTRCVHGPSCSCLGSFTFVFTVPHICVCGLAFVALHLWPRVCGFAFVALHLWLRVCGFVFVALCLCLCLWPRVHVRVCDPSCLCSWPCICVCVRSPLHSCSCSWSLVFVFAFAVPCICVHDRPLAFIVFTTAPSLALTCVGYI